MDKKLIEKIIIYAYEAGWNEQDSNPHGCVQEIFSWDEVKRHIDIQEELKELFGDK